MAEIIPTILTRDVSDLEDKIHRLEGVVDRVQIDIIDGFFLPEKTIDLEVLSEIETSLKFDIHLMVKNPEEWIGRCVDVMADRIIGQVEMMENKEIFIEEAAAAGLSFGFGFDINTSIKMISPETILKADLVLVLTRQAGFGEYSFDPVALEKIKELKKIGGNLLDIYVDGGINENNVKDCVSAGANLIAVGGRIWEAVSVEEEVEKLRSFIR